MSHPDPLYDPSEETQYCSICKRPFEGWGNNADPVNNGRCCDTCNMTVVIPARMTLIQLKHSD